MFIGVRKKPTLKEENLARIAIKNPHLSKKKIAELGGYKTISALNGAGFKTALAQYGLTEELIATALVRDIKGKPKKRARELQLGADILKMTQKETGPNVLILNVNDEQKEKAKQAINLFLNENNSGNN